MATAKSHNEQMLELKERYFREGGERPTTAKRLAQWALEKGHWEQDPKKVLQACADDFSTALGLEKRLDKQGRLVRFNHCARRDVIDEGGKTTQQYFWDSIDKATPLFMRLSFEQRRGGVAADVAALKVDIQSFNENYLPDGASPIRMLFNFDDESGAESPAA